jgi:isoleucyl-tRNA synthetase
LIVNGIVLAEDGSKMSKSKKNYPDPMKIAHDFGADACRLYLCNSPVVRAEPLKFASEGVKGIVRDVFLPWFNAYRFLIQNISRWEKATGHNFTFNPSLKNELWARADANIMDKWIITANQHLIQFVREEMDNYRLYNVVKHMLQFLEQLTNWYVRLNRSRMKGEEGPEEQFTSLNTLFDVLLNTTIMMSCITPFLSEYVYQNMRNGIHNADPLYAESIHFLSIPNYQEGLINDRIEKMVDRMQSAIEIGRKIRDQKNKSIKTPLSKVTIVHSDKLVGEDLVTLAGYIKDELNCLEFEIQTNEAEFVEYLSEPDHKLIG